MLARVMKWIAGIVGGVILLAFLVIATMILISRPMPDHPFFDNFPEDEIIVLAHQGGDGEFPSNTLYAFEQATALGVHALELDIHSTTDDVLVVIHDDTVDRTTDGSGRVNEMTFAEIQTLDAGYNWPTLRDHPLYDSGQYPYRGQGHTIPSLEEIFIAFPEMPISVELKQVTPSIAQALCDMIRAYDRENLTIVASFRPVAMDEFRDACPEVATAGVEPDILPFVLLNLVGLGSAWQPTVEAFMVPEYQGNIPVVNRSFADSADGHNVAVYPWTINAEEDMLRMIDYGVEGLITDYPTLALELTRGIR